MVTITVNQLIAEIYKGVNREKDDINKDSIYKNYLLKFLEFDSGNEHLQNALNTFEEVFYFRKREEPLTGKETVKGNFLLFYSVSHNDTNLVSTHKNLTEIENEITSESGIQNMYTSYMIVIENGTRTF